MRVDIQTGLRRRRELTPSADGFCIGVNLGDVMIEGEQFMATG